MKDILTADRGSTIVIEVEFNRADPFVDDVAFDPTSPTITVTNPAGTEVVAAASLSQYGTGQWYYNIQTTTAWVVGLYDVKINATSGSYTDVTINHGMFRLV